MCVKGAAWAQRVFVEKGLRVLPAGVLWGPVVEVGWQEEGESLIRSNMCVQLDCLQSIPSAQFSGSPRRGGIPSWQKGLAGGDGRASGCFLELPPET